jgi:hypothetical protein
MERVTSKQRILDALADLADDVSIEDAMERLYALAKIEKGLAQLDAGQSLGHEESSAGSVREPRVRVCAQRDQSSERSTATAANGSMCTDASSDQAPACCQPSPLRA